MYQLGDWRAPLVPVLVLDRLSALMVLLTAVLALLDGSPVVVEVINEPEGIFDRERLGGDGLPVESCMNYAAVDGATSFAHAEVMRIVRAERGEWGALSARR